jgi:hypothetical protein
MFEGTPTQVQPCVSLPVSSGGDDALLSLARRGYYFAFYFTAYAPASGWWSASGRLDQK